MISNLSDVWDGLALKPLMSPRRFFSTPNHLALSLSIDGVPLFKSSSTSLWPVSLVILNLPSKIRTNAQNILLAGVWVGPCKPPVNLLIDPVVKTIQSLTTVGLRVATATGIETIRARLVMGIFDLPAKASALCIKQFNGEHGCPVCHHPGKRLSNNARVYLPEAHTLRTHDKWIADAAEAERTSSAVNGILRRSPLASDLDMVVSMPIDYMHAVLEGVVRRLTNQWFNSANHSMPYYLGRQIKSIDHLLQQQHPPSEFSRPPRSIKQHLQFWKASEFRSWLLYYSLPILFKFLPPLYWHHYSLLVCSMHILLQAEVSCEQIDLAEKMLFDFYQLLPELYGESACTINAHLLGHLCMYVRCWGPLWTHSAFGFESSYGILKHMFHGKGDVVHQLLFNVDVLHTLQLLRPHLNRHEARHTVAFLNKHVSARLNMTLLPDQLHIYRVGPFTKIRVTSAEIEALGLANTSLEVFLRLYKDGTLYYSLRWSRSRKRDDTICSFVQSDSSTIKFGRIHFFCLSSPPFALVSVLHSLQTSLTSRAGQPCRQSLRHHQRNDVLSSYVIPVETSAQLIKVPIINIKDKVVLINTPNDKYIVVQPNNVEHN